MPQAFGRCAPVQTSQPQARTQHCAPKDKPTGRLQQILGRLQTLPTSIARRRACRENSEQTWKRPSHKTRPTLSKPTFLIEKTLVPSMAKPGRRGVGWPPVRRPRHTSQHYFGCHGRHPTKTTRTVLNPNRPPGGLERAHSMSGGASKRTDPLLRGTRCGSWD